jgi:hypothetical protein
MSLALGVTPAFADARKLGKARDAVSAVRYDDAQVLLVEALQSGTNSPEELAEIYRLSASTAIVLGQADAAEQYYRRWLALVPTASLPESVAPKLRQPFVAAQAYMAAHGRLSVKAQRLGDVVDVIVESDPLGMVASVALDDGEPRALGADRTAHLALVAAQTSTSVRVLDEFGNRLLELRGGAIAHVEPPRDSGPTALAHAPRLPVYRRPLAWTIAGSAFAIGGIAFGLAARSAHADVVEISANPHEHFASELDAARSRRERNALVANIGFVAAGACAFTAAVMWATRSSTAVAVIPGSNGAAVVMSRAF